MDMTAFHSFWTVVALLMFVGIFVWAWSSRRKEEFDVMSRLPLDDDHMPPEKYLKNEEH